MLGRSPSPRGLRSRQVSSRDNLIILFLVGSAIFEKISSGILKKIFLSHGSDSIPDFSDLQQYFAYRHMHLGSHEVSFSTHLTEPASPESSIRGAIKCFIETDPTLVERDATYQNYFLANLPKLRTATEPAHLLL